jgi:3D (Asp-Asp-Asp) domain-containing protein
MSIHLNMTVGIACLSILLPISSSSQKEKQSLPQNQFTNEQLSTAPSSSIDPDLPNQLAIVSGSSVFKGTGDTRTELSKENVIAEPKVRPKNPAIDFEITPQESRLNSRPFADPSLEVLGEPRDFSATAYALRGITRSGIYVRPGVIAADPRVLPLGSVVQIKAGGWSGVYTVEDTGRLIKGNIIDVWLPTTREAMQFGRRNIKLHILRLGRSKRNK